MIPLVLIAAVAENGVIGGENRLPWRIKSDLVRFRRMTMGHPVILGRKTFQSIGRPLEGRETIVLTRHGSSLPQGIRHAATPAAARALAETAAARLNADKIFVAGGAEIYGAFLPLASRIELTLVALNPEGDACFPAIDADEWREISREAGVRGPADEAEFTYVTLARH